MPRKRQTGLWFERPWYWAAFWLAMIAIGASALTVVFVGWFGLVLVGLVGLAASVRLQLHDGNAVPDSNFGSTGVYLVAMQNAERDKRGWAQRIIAAQEKRARERILYVLNSFWIAMIVLGLVMFTRHQI